MAEQQSTQGQGAVVAVAERPAQTKSTHGVGRPLRLLRTMVLLVLAVALLGAVPAALSGTYFGFWHLPFVPSASPIPTTNRNDLALPRAAWAAMAATVQAEPGNGDPIATLQPGYPVTLKARRAVGATSWFQITWAGPTASSGGEGWALASAFTSYGAGTTPIGDIGAFSPALAHAVSSQGTHLAVSLYFTRTGYLYQSNAAQSFALGDGLRGPLLVDTLASAEAATTPTSLPLSQLVQIAGGDSAACIAAYRQLGGSSGLASFLAGTGTTGMQLSANAWSSAQASATSLLVFYESLREGRILTTADRVFAMSLLQGSDTAVVSAVGGARPLAGNGPLVVSVAQQPNGWTVSAVGVATVPGGEDYTVVAVASDLPSQAAAQQALATFFGALAPFVAA